MMLLFTRVLTEVTSCRVVLLWMLINRAKFDAGVLRT
jgi:hypothetical protein